MGPPIHYYGDMNMAEDQDKNNMSKDELEKMVESIIDEVFNKLDLKDEEEEEDTTEEE
jgi:hypothetical protein